HRSHVHSRGNEREGLLEVSTRVFLDTNIFVYSLNLESPDKRDIAEALIGETISSKAALISYQVVQEFLNVVTRKLRHTMTTADASDYLQRILWPICEVHPTAALYEKALAIREKAEWAFYDSLIVAGALISGCAVLYSEDLQDGRIVEGLEI